MVKITHFMFVLLAFSVCSCRSRADNVQYDHYLKYYQVRYGKNMGKPLPEGLVKFVIVGPELDKDLGIPKYAYLQLTMALGNMKTTTRTEHLNNRYLTTLNSSEINRLFKKYGEDAPDGTKNHFINLAILQKADIEKIHKQLKTHNPNLPALEDISYGVELDSNREPVLDFEGKVIPDSNAFDYRNGRTIVLPESWSSAAPHRLFHNLNNPAVREYCVRVALKTNLLYGVDVFLDNYGIIGRLERSVVRKYFAQGTKAQNLTHYANKLAGICKDIKRRRQMEIIANCFLPRKNQAEEQFLITLTSSENIIGFDGFMAEGIFGPYGYTNDDINWYLKWIKYLDERGKKLLLAPSKRRLSTNKRSRFAMNFYLFANLIARDNLYLWCSNTTYRPMVDYEFFHFPLGYPSGESPVFSNGLWKREYQRGSVILNLEKSGFDAIWFSAD